MLHGVYFYAKYFIESNHSDVNMFAKGSNEYIFFENLTIHKLPEDILGKKLMSS